jgi:hypothetical protein
MTLKDFWQQFTKLVPVLLLVYLPGVVLIGVLYILYRTGTIPFGIIFSDPTEYLEYNRLNGLVLYLGIFLLISSAAVCIFNYFILRSRDHTGSEGRFLLFFGLFSILLAVDDLFMVHEGVSDAVATVTAVTDDLGEAITFAVYILVFAFFTLKYRKVIYRTEYFLFIVSIVFFVLSISLDLLPVSLPDNPLFKGEEIFKFFAFITWFVYAARTALKMVKNTETTSLP